MCYTIKTGKSKFLLWKGGVFLDKEKLLVVFNVFLTSNVFIEDALTKFLNYLVLKANSLDTPKNLKPQYSALANMFSRYIRYLDPHDVKNGPLELEKVNHIKPIMQILKATDEFLQSEFPDTQFDPIFRIKALFTYMEKIWRERSPLQAKNTLRDLVALRFTLKSSLPEENVIKCYYFAAAVIPYLKSLGFKPVDADELKNPSSEKDRASYDPNYFYIPNPDEIPEVFLEFEKFTKDYILVPKKNKYQGLHITLYHPLLDVYLEIQIKTDYMLDHAENHQASHFIYKDLIAQQNGDSNSDSIDYRMYNNLSGFISRDGKTFTDTIGLFTPRIYRIL